MDFLIPHIESLIFTAESPIRLTEIQSCLEETFGSSFPEAELLDVIDRLRERYNDELAAFEIVEINQGYQLMTKPAFHRTVGVYLKQTTKKRLSQAALETLSIIAYKQPLSKSDVEKIRGVNCDYAMQKLLEKELVTITGRSEGPGRPLLYGTTEKFMDYFGLKSLKDLPQPKDFKDPEGGEIGEQTPIEEQVT
jgi:segregation and condensation protein B